MFWSSPSMTTECAATRYVHNIKIPDTILSTLRNGSRRVLGFSDHHVAEIHKSGALNPSQKHAAE